MTHLSHRTGRSRGGGISDSTTMLYPLHKGDEVFWTDPGGGLASGFWTVVDSPDDDPAHQAALDESPGIPPCSEDDIFTLTNAAGGCAEVFRHELS